MTKFSLILYGMLFLAVNAGSQTTAWNRLSAMGSRGYNLSNWLEAYWLGASYPNPREYTREEMDALAHMGFHSVRVPLLFERITSDVPPYDSALNKTPFAIVDSVILASAHEKNMAVILVNHHGFELTNANWRAAMPRLCGMWIALTERFRGLPRDRIFFELRNEPALDIHNDTLHILQQAIIDSIRAHDADRTLIVGANWWNAGWSLADSRPYNDAADNIIYTFHNYDPYEFTHQGFSWTGLPTGPTFTYPGKAADDIRAVFLRVKNWSVLHKVPVFLGEFGVSWFADEASRCAYIACLTNLCEEFDFPWIYWDVKHGHDAFGIFSGSSVRYSDLIPCFRNAMGLVDTVSTVEHTAAPRSVALDVFPDPVSDLASVSYTLAEPGTVLLTASDLLGREVAVLASGRHEAGIFSAVWRCAELPAGAFILRLSAGTSTRHRLVQLLR